MLSRPNILACVDFSEHTQTVLAAADKMAKASDGNLTVLHCAEPSEFWSWLLEADGKVEEKDLRNTVSSRLTNKLTNLLATSNIKARAVVDLEAPEKGINSLLKNNKYDLLVLGHSRHTGQVLTLGSVAAKFISLAELPVLVVKTSELSKIAALLDPDKAMDKIISSAEELSNLLSAKLECVSIFPDIKAKFYGWGKFGVSTALLSLTEEQKETLITGTTSAIREQLKNKDNTVVCVEINEDRKIHTSLLRVLKRDKVDLVVMKRHQSDILEQFMIGSETRRMLELYPGNLFILPPE